MINGLTPNRVTFKGSYVCKSVSIGLYSFLDFTERKQWSFSFLSMTTLQCAEDFETLYSVPKSIVMHLCLPDTSRGDGVAPPAGRSWWSSLGSAVVRSFPLPIVFQVTWGNRSQRVVYHDLKFSKTRLSQDHISRSDGYIHLISRWWRTRKTRCLSRNQLQRKHNKDLIERSQKSTQQISYHGDFF